MCGDGLRPWIPLDLNGGPAAEQNGTGVKKTAVSLPATLQFQFENFVATSNSSNVALLRRLPANAQQRFSYKGMLVCQRVELLAYLGEPLNLALESFC